jgi:hypothetical protein
VKKANSQERRGGTTVNQNVISDREFNDRLYRQGLELCDKPCLHGWGWAGEVPESLAIVLAKGFFGPTPTPMVKDPLIDFEEVVVGEAVAPEGCCCARRLLVAPEGCCAARVDHTVSDRCV